MSLFFPAPGANIYRTGFREMRSCRSICILLQDIKALVNSLCSWHGIDNMEDSVAILELLYSTSLYHAFFFQASIFLKSQMTYTWELLPQQTPLPQEKALIGGLIGGIETYVHWLQHECEFFTRTSSDRVSQQHTFAILKTMQIQAKLLLAPSSEYRHIIKELQEIRGVYYNLYSPNPPLTVNEAKLHTKFQPYITMMRDLADAKELLRSKIAEQTDQFKQSINFLSVYYSQNAPATISQEALESATKTCKKGTQQLYVRKMAALEFYQHLPLFARGSLCSMAYRLNANLAYRLHENYCLLHSGEYRFGHKHAQIMESKYSDRFTDFKTIFSLQDALSKRSVATYSASKLLIAALIAANRRSEAKEEVMQLMPLKGIDAQLIELLYSCDDKLTEVSISDILARHVNMLTSGDSYEPLLRILGLMHCSTEEYHFITADTSKLCNTLLNRQTCQQLLGPRNISRKSTNYKVFTFVVDEASRMQASIASIRWLAHHISLAFVNYADSGMLLVQKVTLYCCLMIIPLELLLDVKAPDKAMSDELNSVLIRLSEFMDPIFSLVSSGKHGALFLAKSPGYAALVTFMHLAAVATEEQYYNHLHDSLITILKVSSLHSENAVMIERYSMLHTLLLQSNYQ